MHPRVGNRVRVDAVLERAVHFHPALPPAEHDPGLATRAELVKAGRRVPDLRERGVARGHEARLRVERPVEVELDPREPRVIHVGVLEHFAEVDVAPILRAPRREDVCRSERRFVPRRDALELAVDEVARDVMEGDADSRMTAPGLSPTPRRRSSRG